MLDISHLFLQADSSNSFVRVPMQQQILGGRSYAEVGRFEHTGASVAPVTPAMTDTRILHRGNEGAYTVIAG